MLGQLVRRRDSAVVEERDAMSWEAYQNLFSFNANQYVTGSPFTNANSRYLMSACGPVVAVLDRRVSIMGEARPTWQRLESGRPTQLFSTPELDVLKVPWVGGTWRHLMAAIEADNAAAGNSYWVRRGRELVHLNPAWVSIVLEGVDVGGVDAGSRLLGYVVSPPGKKPTALEPGDVAHYRPGAPVECPFRGESWLAAVASDASADLEMTRYKGAYLKNGAMPSLAVTYDQQFPQERLEQFVQLFADKFVGAMNAGKVMHFLGGRDVKTVGATLDQLAFKAVQGAGETRIAAAGGVPAAVAGFSEGLQGSSLNAGNYTATRRLFGDAKIRPLLGSACDAFTAIVPPPSGARLSYDDSLVSFFQEDVSDEANIRQLNATTIKTLIEAGYEPDACVQAVISGSFTGLVGSHTGLTSVQLQAPGAGTPSATAD